MPRYDYHCQKCDKDFVLSHSYRETVEECPECRAPDIVKVLNTPINTRHKDKSVPPKVGSVVKEFIKTSKQNTVQQKKELLDRKKK
tara:strand:- start:527 stop:784 length:258 start_codon:yes stop_codon:yes gene_type:complete